MNDAEKLRELHEDLAENYVMISRYGLDLLRIASDLEKKAVSDEEINKEAFKYVKYLESLPLQGTVHINCFETGAKWMREKLTGKS